MSRLGRSCWSRWRCGFSGSCQAAFQSNDLLHACLWTLLALCGLCVHVKLSREGAPVYCRLAQAFWCGA